MIPPAVEKTPPWLAAKIDQRMALLEQAVGNKTLDVSLVMTPLTEPREGASDAEHQRWDRSCDNCGRYCPPAADFYTGHVVRFLSNGTRVYISFGVCINCKPSIEKENQ